VLPHRAKRSAVASQLLLVADRVARRSFTVADAGLLHTHRHVALRGDRPQQAVLTNIRGKGHVHTPATAALQQHHRGKRSLAACRDRENGAETARIVEMDGAVVEADVRHLLPRIGPQHDLSSGLDAITHEHECDSVAAILSSHRDNHVLWYAHGDLACHGDYVARANACGVGRGPGGDGSDGRAVGMCGQGNAEPCSPRQRVPVIRLRGCEQCRRSQNEEPDREYPPTMLHGTHLLSVVRNADGDVHQA